MRQCHVDGFLNDIGLIHHWGGVRKRNIWAMEIKCKTSSTATRTFWDDVWLLQWEGRKNLRIRQLDAE